MYFYGVLFVFTSVYVFVFVFWQKQKRENVQLQSQWVLTVGEPIAYSLSRVDEGLARK